MSCNSQVAKVVDGGYCIGCGVCAVLAGEPGRSNVLLDAKGFYQIDVGSLDSSFSNVDQVCPFSNSAADEDTMGSEIHGSENQYHSSIGRYSALYAGYVKSGEFRQRGSSGGMTSWVLAGLFEAGEIDGVVHVGTSEREDLLYEYRISRSIQELSQSSKSQYYPVEMSNVLNDVRSTPGRYAIVGVPCFVKAVRLLMRQDEVLDERIRYCVGLFCGHLKSKGFAEYLAFQMGIHPGQLADFDFRTKLSDRPASKYAVSATARSGKKESSPTHSLKGTDWGMGFFKYKACDFCDDISAELADISIGDAWLPEYESDYKGTNLVITRNKTLEGILTRGDASGSIHLEPITLDKALQSQKANVRHRQDEIGYRLHVEDLAGRWRPQKRRKPSPELDPKRVDIQDARARIRELLPTLWAEAKSHGNYRRFNQHVRREIKLYNQLYGRHSSLTDKLVGKLKIYCRRFFSI